MTDIKTAQDNIKPNDGIKGVIDNLQTDMVKVLKSELERQLGDVR